MTCEASKPVPNVGLRAWWVVSTVFCTTVLYFSTGLAQAPVTSSGLSTQVDPSPAPPPGKVQYDITGGTRAGTNLFHSFGEFNVPTNNVVNFQNDSGLATSNILGRVTGGNHSSIFGTIQTTEFGNANLFLMNPAGIVFGPNASLNVGGSVTFTTADYMRLDKVGGPNAGIFHANPAQTSLLSSAPVDAFGFLGTYPSSIAIQGSRFSVPEKQGITLIGGNITIQNGILENGTVQPARLSAPKGQINLTTTTSPGEFLQDLTASPNINGTSFRSYGSAHFTAGSTVDFSQTENGKISIRGGELVLEVQNAVLDTAGNSASTTGAQSQNTVVLAPSSSIIGQTSSSDPGPEILIKADQITILGVPGTAANSAMLPFSGIKSHTKSAGNAGNIVLKATGDIETVSYVTIESVSASGSPGTTGSTVTIGNAGNIELTSAHGNIMLTEGGRATFVYSQAENSNTGNVIASALDGDIVLEGASLLTSVTGQGGAGRVEVTAKNLLMNAGLLSNESIGPFKPGGITVNLSGNLTMAADFSIQPPVPPISFIVTSAFSPTGTPAADINITAKQIAITQGSLISSETFASGPGGQLNIISDTLQIMGGSRVASGSTFAPPFGHLPRGIVPTGKGGDITIRSLTGPAVSILIDGSGSGIFSDTVGEGTGGSINLSAQSLTIQNGGIVSASTTGTDTRAVGGSIIINATDQVALTNGSSITASSIVKPETPNSGIANAGNISINAGQQLDLQASSITTKAEKASGGNIDIRAIDSIRFANSTISASVNADRGNGGNITIDPRVVILQNSDIFAQASRGNGGDITITTPTFLRDQTSRIDASSQFGVNGTVTIQSPTSNLSGTVAQLTSKTDQTQPLLQNRCVALAGGEQSTFILAGRDVLPAEPGGWLSSPVAMEHWTGGDTEEHASGLMVRRKGPNGLPAMAADKTNVLSLRRLTPPGFLVRTFATGATGCPS